MILIFKGISQNESRRSGNKAKFYVREVWDKTRQTILEIKFHVHV